MIYVFTIFLILFLDKALHPQRISDRNQTGIIYDSNRKKYCIIISIWFIFLLTFRHAYVGSDTQNYYKIFNEFKTFGFSFELTKDTWFTEFGFYALVKFLTNVNLPFRFLIFISASLYVFSISLLIYRYSQRPWISYFIFLTFGYFIFNTTMRQCFALSFCVLSFLSLINKRLIVAIALSLLAVSFHSTAIIFLPALFVPILKYNKKSLLLVLAIGVFISLFAAIIYQSASEFIGKNYVVQKSTGYFSLLIYIIVAIFGYIYRRKIPNINRYWFYLLIVSIILFPLANINPALFRIRLYFSIFIIVYLANLATPKIQTYHIIYALIIWYGLYSFFIGYNLAGIRVLPYVFYWENYYQLNPEASGLGLYPPDS